MVSRTLIFIPTYNERENVETLLEELLSLNMEDTDILFIDDGSPDGTGDLLECLSVKHRNVHVVHRSGKLGVGSAHREAIQWAYDRRYGTLITMDSDFTHSPSYIPKLIAASFSHDVVVTSRYMERDSLEEWNLFRKTLTITGHLLTRYLLKLEYDATGAFRLYKLSRLPARLFTLIRSNSYSFFFESLLILHLNQCTIREIPIKLPSRTYGHSKMKMKDAWGSLFLLFDLYWKIYFCRNSLTMKRMVEDEN